MNGLMSRRRGGRATTAVLAATMTALTMVSEASATTFTMATPGSQPETVFFVRTLATDAITLDLGAAGTACSLVNRQPGQGFAPTCREVVTANARRSSSCPSQPEGRVVFDRTVARDVTTGVPAPVQRVVDLGPIPRGSSLGLCLYTQRTDQPALEEQDRGWNVAVGPYDGRSPRVATTTSNWQVRCRDVPDRAGSPDDDSIVAVVRVGGRTIRARYARGSSFTLIKRPRSVGARAIARVHCEGKQALTTSDGGAGQSVTWWRSDSVSARPRR